jgi:hypothetical protein
MDSKQSASWVPVEFYIQSQVLCGYIHISSELRLLDILNRIGSKDRDSTSDYIEFMTTISTDGNEYRDARYVRKASVELAAIAEADLARGVGAKTQLKVYPFAEKTQRRVSLQMPTYALDGTMHCTLGHSVRDTLDEKLPFLPLTDVTIAIESHLYGTRPFVAVKKEQIISLKEE